MSESALARLRGMRQVMCLTCGAVRPAAAQHVGRETPMLPCDRCDETTTHAAVNWDGLDVKEVANLYGTQVTAEATREHAALLELFRCCQIDVLDGGLDPNENDGAPLGGLVDVVRWLEPEGYQVRLLRNLSLVDLVYCLDWAWKSLRPGIAEWHRCLVEVDPDGQPFQRIYNNELERGIYELS